MRSIKIHKQATAFKYSAVHGELTLENKGKKQKRKTINQMLESLAQRACLRTVPPNIQKYFCTVFDYGRKVDYWNPGRSKAPVTSQLVSAEVISGNRKRSTRIKLRYN